MSDATPKKNDKLINADAVENSAALPTGDASPALASGNDAGTDAKPVGADANAQKGAWRVLHTQVGKYVAGDLVDFEDGVDTQRLVDLGAIEAAKG